jgi:hypothetical protein
MSKHSLGADNESRNRSKVLSRIEGRIKGYFGHDPGGIELHVLQMSETGRGVLVACDEERISALSASLSNMPGCPEYSIYKAGQAPTGCVIEQLLDYLANDRARIKILSHAALYCIPPSWPCRNEWNLSIFNEISLSLNGIPLVLPFSATLPDDHGLISRHLQIIPDGSVYGSIVIDDPYEFERRAQHIHGDDTLKAFAEVLRVLGNGYHETRVVMKDYHEALEGKHREVTFFAIRLPAVMNGFRSAKTFDCE